jgi:hypothetical protein
MLSYEIPQSALDIIDWASTDVFRDHDSPDWSPYRLSEPLLTVWAVVFAQGIIDNGGFGYFFENDFPENPPYSVFWEAFRRIGALESSQCIESAANLFPAQHPELDYQMRRDYLNLSREMAAGKRDAIDELASRFIDLGGSAFQLLVEYIQDHSNHFPTVTLNRTNQGEQAGSSNGG